MRLAEIGAENYRKPHIRAAIDARMAEMDAKRVASADEVVQFFTTVMRGELEEEVVTNDLERCKKWCKTGIISINRKGKLSRNRHNS